MWLITSTEVQLLWSFQFCASTFPLHLLETFSYRADRLPAASEPRQHILS